MIKMKLANDRVYSEGLGHCQVTYYSKNDQGQKIVYCLQWQGKEDVRLMRCSQDGEPSHEVKFKDIADFERPKADKDSRLEKSINKWIDNYEAEQIKQAFEPLKDIK